MLYDSHPVFHESNTTAPPAAGSVDSPQLQLYRSHLESTIRWILRTERPTGGSAAFFSPFMGWSRAYPETTGYIIPTLLDAGRELKLTAAEACALRFGRWLRVIQNTDGSWNGGLHPPRKIGSPSIFNTGQILKGMMALWRWTGDAEWLAAARNGSRWLVTALGPSGVWEARDYKGSGTPSYYSEVIWPMLDVSLADGNTAALAACRRALDRILERVLTNGAIRHWGFGGSETAFTHTIAYTIRGIQESALLLNDTAIAEAVTPAIERLVRAAELRAGRLPGSFDEEWRPDRRYVCLTGNAQMALCVLRLHERSPDLRLVSAAARLVDVVCRTQRVRGPLRSFVGGVAGSAPFSGAYMRGRYPNWAAKYTADALMAVIRCVESYRCQTVRD